MSYRRVKVFTDLHDVPLRVCIISFIRLFSLSGIDPEDITCTQFLHFS